MTAATIVIDDSDIQEGLQRLLDAAGDLAPVLKNIGEYEAEQTKDRFRDQRDRTASPGSPSTRFTRRRRKDRGSSPARRAVSQKSSGSSPLKCPSKWVRTSFTPAFTTRAA